MTDKKVNSIQAKQALHQSTIWMVYCFDTVGWVIRPVKTVGRITYIVLAQM